MKSTVMNPKERDDRLQALRQHILNTIYSHKTSTSSLVLVDLLIEDNNKDMESVDEPVELVEVCYRCDERPVSENHKNNPLVTRTCDDESCSSDGAYLFHCLSS